jgi:hypothetical protein
MPTARQQFEPPSRKKTPPRLDRLLLKTSLLQTHPRTSRSSYAHRLKRLPLRRTRAGNRMCFLFTMSMNPPAIAGETARRPDERRGIAVWWSQTGSNRRPPACKAGALPAELWPRQMTEGRRQTTEDLLPSVVCSLSSGLVGLGRLELPTSRLSSARSNQLSYKPEPEDGKSGGQATENKGQRSPVVCHLSSIVRAPSSGKKEKRRRRNPAIGIRCQ